MNESTNVGRIIVNAFDSETFDGRQLRGDAADFLWRHFADMTIADRDPLPVMVRGEGCYLYDVDGKRYLDGLSNLCCVNLGYSYGEELGRAAFAQYQQLGYQSSWGATHPKAIELARTLVELAPNEMGHAYFTPSGGEAVDAAWKIARQYFRTRGENRWKAIARSSAYHGTTMGALSIMGIPEIRTPFEPLIPGTATVRNTRRLDRPDGETEEEFTQGLLADLEQRILDEDPSTIAMLIIEPVQNHGGMLVPPAGYMTGVRALCDKYGILVVADEIVTAFGRCGAWFASERFGLRPDIIVLGKGLSSAHAVIGAVLTTDEIFQMFRAEGRMFSHGNTFGGHPVMAAVTLRNIELMKELDLPNVVRQNEGDLRERLESLLDIPIVRDVRGCGYFFAIEMISHFPDGTAFTDADRARLYGDELLAHRLRDKGLIIRVALDGGDPVINVAPPLVAGAVEFDQIVTTLREVLVELSGDAGLSPSALTGPGIEAQGENFAASSTGI